jgi:hypothetical protein
MRKTINKLMAYIHLSEKLDLIFFIYKAQNKPAARLFTKEQYDGQFVVI